MLFGSLNQWCLAFIELPMNTRGNAIVNDLAFTNRPALKLPTYESPPSRHNTKKKGCCMPLRSITPSKVLASRRRKQSTIGAWS